MKKVIFAILIIFGLAQASYADVCATSLIPTFTSEQAQLLCSRGLRVINPSANFETLAGAGTNQATATAVSSTIYNHRLTGANGTVGWILPAVAARHVGRPHTFFNTTAGVVNLYPEVGGTINGASANAVFAALTGIKPIICYPTAALTWICS